MASIMVGDQGPDPCMVSARGMDEDGLGREIADAGLATHGRRRDCQERQRQEGVEAAAGRDAIARVTVATHGSTPVDAIRSVVAIREIGPTRAIAINDPTDLTDTSDMPDVRPSWAVSVRASRAGSGMAEREWLQALRFILGGLGAPVQRSVAEYGRGETVGHPI
jgi:hypothetical protein